MKTVQQHLDILKLQVDQAYNLYSLKVKTGISKKEFEKIYDAFRALLPTYAMQALHEYDGLNNKNELSAGATKIVDNAKLDLKKLFK